MTSQLDKPQSIIVTREQLAKWESWARVRGNELRDLTGTRDSTILSDGLADEMKAALESPASPSATAKPEDGRCGICKQEIEEFNSGVEAWRAGVAFADLPDMPMDQNGVGWAWAAWNGKTFAPYVPAPSADTPPTSALTDFDFSFEEYVNGLKWSDKATEHEKTLVVGNLRGMFSAIREKHNAFVLAARTVGVGFDQYDKLFKDLVRDGVLKFENDKVTVCTRSASAKQEFILPAPDANGKRQRLFYWEDTEDAWCPADGLEVDNIISTDSFLRDGDILEIRFKRQDMTDAEFDAIPEG